MKVMGGIRGITQKPVTLSRFFLIAPELGRLSQEAEDLAGLTDKCRSKHHDLSPSVIRQQETRIEQLKSFVRGVNPLLLEGNELLNFVTNCILPT